jgi:parvulin-like peptidyl-prolyl isomerase
VGAALGLAGAALGLLQPDATAGLPDDAVARVNGELVLREEYERLVAALASDRRAPIDGEARRFVLDRMIDEELLVQRGLELGLPRHDRRVRGDLTSALITSVVSESEEEEPGRAELEAFYAENRDFFSRTGRLHLRQVFLRDGPDAAARAAEAARRLRAGEPVETVREELGDPEVAPLPDGPLPAVKLREYLGPTALRAALALEPGEVAGPIRSGTGRHVLVLVSREADAAPPFAEIEDLVRAEYRRREGERALRAYLDSLRRHADVVVVRELE